MLKIYKIFIILIEIDYLCLNKSSTNYYNRNMNSNIPKTWSEFIKTGNISYSACTHIEDDNTPIIKAAKALLKIHQLIEVGYGGNITDEEWQNANIFKYTITVNHTKPKTFNIDKHRFKQQNSISYNRTSERIFILS